MSLGFPGLTDMRGAIRAPINPTDKSTVFSIYPKHIHEVKPTIQPGYFDIEPGTFEKPSSLVVGSSSWWLSRDLDQPLVEVPNHSAQVAESIVKDYCNGILGCDMDQAIPGLFFIPGEISVTKLKTDFKQVLENARIKQNNWFRSLVNMADSLWARTNGNVLTISEDMRLAATSLGLNSKEWMKNQQAFEMVRCFACGSFKNGQFPVCSTCGAIDEKHPEAKNIKFASR